VRYILFLIDTGDMVLKDRLVQIETKNCIATQIHSSTPLLCREKTLPCSSNKVQIIDILFDFVSRRVVSKNSFTH